MSNIIVLSTGTDAAVHAQWVVCTFFFTCSTLLSLSCCFLLLHNAHYLFSVFPVLCIFDVCGNFQECNTTYNESPVVANCFTECIPLSNIQQMKRKLNAYIAVTFTNRYFNLLLLQSQFYLFCLSAHLVWFMAQVFVHMCHLPRSCLFLGQYCSIPVSYPEFDLHCCYLCWSFCIHDWANFQFEKQEEVTGN